MVHCVRSRLTRPAIEYQAIYLSAILVFGGLPHAHTASEQRMRGPDEKQSSLPFNKVEASAWYAKGIRHEQKGELKEALAAYSKAIDFHPAFLPSKIRKASVYYQLDQIPDAIAVLEEARKQFGDSTELNTLLALGYVRQEKKEEALSLANKAITSVQSDTQRDVTFYIRMGELLGRLLSEINNPSPNEIAAKLLPVFERAAELEPFNPNIIHRVSEMAMASGDKKKALQYLRQLYGLAPDFPGIREQLSAAYLANGEEDKALKMLESIINEDPEKKNLYPLLGQLYEKSGNYEKAAENYLLALKTSSPKVEDYLRLAVLHLRNNKSGDAIAVLKDAAKAFPDAPQVYILQARAYRLSGQNREALAAFTLTEAKSAATKSLLDSQFYFEFGVALEQSGDLESADTRFRKSIEMNPENHMAMNYLAYMWAERGKKLDESETLLKRALTLSPDNPAYLDSLGWVYFKKGDLEQAKSLLLKAQAHTPDDPAVNEHLGDLFEKMGDIQAAKKYWQAAIDAKHPHPELVQQKLKQIENRTAGKK